MKSDHHVKRHGPGPGAREGDWFVVQLGDASSVHDPQPAVFEADKVHDRFRREVDELAREFERALARSLATVG